jgi:hypothetical protein
VDNEVKISTLTPFANDMNINVIAVCTSRVVFGNERAFRDAVIAVGKMAKECSIIVRHEDWNSKVNNFFLETGYSVKKIPVVEYPMRGWILKILKESPIRYIKSNIILYNLIKNKNINTQVIILISDLSIFLTWNFSLILLKLPVLYRCGYIPPNHNILQNTIFYFSRLVIAQYIVDSEFMRSELVKRGVAAEKITVIRPMPPQRVI